MKTNFVFPTNSSVVITRITDSAFCQHFGFNDDIPYLYLSAGRINVLPTKALMNAVRINPRQFALVQFQYKLGNMTITDDVAIYIPDEYRYALKMMCLRPNVYLHRLPVRIYDSKDIDIQTMLIIKSL